MNEIYESMIQPKGAAYRESRVASHSHYRDPIDRTPGRPAGNSRIWGDASPEVQSRSVDAIIAASERAGLNVRQTAHVLAIARVESGFNPDAAAGTTSAFGLGQFINKTGEHYGIRHSNRGELTRQADGLVAHFLDNTALAAKRGKGEDHIYKYHHDGPTAEHGGLRISAEQVSPYIDRYESFVREHRLRRGLTQDHPPNIPEYKTRAAGEPHGARDTQQLPELKVQALQRQLNQLGVRDSDGRPLVVDGDYGRRTREAVASFQREHGLPATGKADETTREAIRGAVEREAAERRAYRVPDMPDHSGFGGLPRASAAPKDHGNKLTYLDAGHPVQPLYRMLRERLPAEVSDEQVAHLTHLGRRCGVREEEVQKVGVHGDKVFVLGLAPSAQVAISLSAPAPSLEETMRQSEAFDRQQSQQRVAQQERSEERSAQPMRI